MLIHSETFPKVNADKSKPSFTDRIKEFMQLLALLFLSFIILALALFISLFVSSLLGAIFTAQETIKYIKDLFQKEKRFSSLLSLLSIGTFAYTGWLLGLILCTAIFSSPVGAIIGTGIFLGWTLGITAIITRYVPKIFSYYFNKSDTNNLLEENEGSINSFGRSVLSPLKENREQNFGSSGLLLSPTPESPLPSANHAEDTVRPRFC
ncbi:MAG TPA: hypothetical protein VGH95_02700 [Candidatus Aquirickettsiella sp.]|jgi:hypothetical protein